MMSTPAAIVHLLLGVDLNLVTYARKQTLNLKALVLNQLIPSLNSTLSLTVTDPRDYYYFDFQTVNVTAKIVGEYSFTWSIPNTAGTYVAEVSLVPAKLTT